mmetsp:Transcript_13087/g.23713  ORF Transcript_13087/g.23713 Transcript_13087/m.23713 type:complete len:837 (-) Transcript_13087:195-2705(-)
MSKGSLASATSQSGKHTNASSAFSVQLSIQFILGTVALGCAVAFGAGSLVASKFTEYSLASAVASPVSPNKTDHFIYSNDIDDWTKPGPTCENESSTCIVEEEEASSDDAEAFSPEESENPIHGYDFNPPGTGQQAMIDIDQVVSEILLSSPENLMTEIASVLKRMGDWDLERFKCTPGCCMAILSSQSHFALHFNVEERWVRFSLFVSSHGTEKLLLVIDELKKLFVPLTGDKQLDAYNESYIKSNSQNRGFFDAKKVKGRNPHFEDLGILYLWTKRLFMKEVATTESIFQRIEIFDLMNPKVQNLDGYRQSLISSEESYAASLPELFKPDRLVFLDGVVQSSSRGDEPYHEALVQPAMFAHPNPRRVAIIGGGEGATLREVLKHKSVEHVKMIDIDEVMVKFSAEHIPAWSDCSDVQGSSESCFDDTRADVLFEDAMAWFINRFVDFEGGVAELFGTEEKFDVVIMDALDPQDTVVFANMLYNSDIFLRSLKNGLADDGVLVMQLGEVSGIDETAEDNQHNKNRASVNRMIVNLGFESMHIYDEPHCGFGDPWSFLVSCKSVNCRQSWYKQPAEIERSIHGRIRRSHSGKPLLKYFDGATMVLYQTPRNSVEIVYCRSNPSPPECQLGMSYVKDSKTFTGMDMEVRKDGPDGEIGVFAKVDIPKYSYIETSSTLSLSSLSTHVAEELGDIDDSKALKTFLDKFGIESTLKGQYEWYADTGLYSLMNHGCNGTSNVGHLESWTGKKSNSELYDRENAARYEIEKPEGLETTDRLTIRSPVLDRHLSSYATGYLLALRDISAGEELTTNYLHRRSESTKWTKLASEVDKFCGFNEE